MGRKKFMVVPRSIRSNYSLHELQGILESDGTVKLGIDIWRSLDKNDGPSYPIIYYPSLEDVKLDYRMIRIRNGYLMPN